MIRKNISSTIVISLLIASSVFSAIDAAAAVRWVKTVHDFGAFKEDGGKVSCEFKFVNTGTDDVSIRAARASCGCTTPSFTKTPIAPGDTGIVTATFNPTGRPGRFSKTISLDISDTPKQTLTIKGVVIGSSNTLRSRYPVEAGPVKLRSSMLPFGTVTKGHAKSAFLEVYNASSEPIVPKWIDMPSYMRYAASSDTIPPGEQIVYSLSLTPSNTSLYGILTDSIFLNVGEEYAPVKIDVTAILEEDFSMMTPSQREKAPHISFDSDRLDFGEFPAQGAPITRSFTIKNVGKSDLMLRRVYSTDQGISVSVPTTRIKKGKSADIFVTVDPSALPSDLLNARIQVIANDPDSPITLIRAIGLPINY